MKPLSNTYGYTGIFTWSHGRRGESSAHGARARDAAADATQHARARTLTHAAACQLLAAARSLATPAEGATCECGEIYQWRRRPAGNSRRRAPRAS